MCSFIVSNQPIADLDHVNEFASKRGPDKTTSSRVGGFHFVHNLLSITGSFAPQPFVEGDVVCVYNGEIYNYRSFGDYDTDGRVLIPLYEELGEDFVRRLDGEFAIVLADFARDRLIVSSDVFATKPLFVALNGPAIGIATYQSCLDRLGLVDAEKVPANTVRTYRLSTLELIRESPIVEFDLHQHKGHFDDWIGAFQRSIEKRSAGIREKIFVGLSSGYDSGTIACELARQQIPFKAYTIVASENQEVLRQRAERLSDVELVRLSQSEYDQARKFLAENCEDFSHDGYDIKSDKASNGLSHVCTMARRDGFKIYFSGQGADEITSDYGRFGEKIYSHSSMGGRFPEDLSEVFPWENFFGGVQKRYINKEEYVAGSHGLEARYPFLDTEVVQEFLWLEAKLKNQEYKAPLHAYLTQQGFPFDRGAKVGFQANKNLRWKLVGKIAAALRSPRG